MKTFNNYINGESVPPVSGDYIDSYNPLTGAVHAKVASSDGRDIDRAVECAKRAFPSWSQSSAQHRSRIMTRIADLLESRLDEFARLESEDQGKPVSLSKRVDIPRAVHNFRFFAGTILHLDDKCTHMSTVGGGSALSYVHRMPVGVAGLISPWNLPLYLLTWKIAPAIAFGNTCVAKPSEVTSATAARLCEVFPEAQLPPGVVNIVFGYGKSAGQALVEHPDVPIISFTGSTPVGAAITESSAALCKKLSLELGGKNAAIVFGDADLDKCVPGVVKSGFVNQGEVCLCTSRVYVHASVYRQFLARYVAMVRALTVGAADDDDTGALVSAEHLTKVRSYVEIARKSGGRIECGHGVDRLPDRCKNGYFFLPTVVSGLPDQSVCMQDEIFGPVVCVCEFTDEADVIARANNVRYGLCASVWTGDVGRAHRVARQLQAGTVWVNCWLVRDLRMPFGGMKMSGVGRESADDSYHFFTEAKTVCVEY